MIKITLIALGDKMPLWVKLAVDEFAKRLQEHAHFSLIEIPLLKRGKGSEISRIMTKESLTIADHIPHNAYLVGLDSKGIRFTSETLAKKLENLLQHSSHLCYLIGGPEGFTTQIRQQCQELWSLSELTLPHPLARIVFLEAIYRGFAIIHHHPYHKL